MECRKDDGFQRLSHFFYVLNLLIFSAIHSVYYKVILKIHTVSLKVKKNNVKKKLVE